MNNVVAIICVAIAVVGTWVLLSPQVETLRPAMSTPGAGAAAAPRSAASPSVSAFSSAPVDDGPRQGLRGKPRMAVGFDQGAVDGAATTAAPRATGATAMPPRGDEAFDVAPVQALGQLPQDAAALAIDTMVEPASNISGAYTLGRFEVRAASRRGSDHVILDEQRQDDYVVAKAANGRYLVVVVADGQGAAENAHYGSYWASRLLAQTIDEHLREGVPGIENMLAKTRDELSTLFDQRFTDDTKLRSIATTLVGLIAPVDGGPAAGFRVGDSDILIDGPNGWASVFGAPTSDQAEAVFPRSIDAEVAPLDFDVNCLLLTTDGVSKPIANNETVAASYSAGLVSPLSEVAFDQLMSFPLEEARDDRTAVAIWFSAPPA